MSRGKVSTMTDTQSKVFGAEVRRLREEAQLSVTEFAKYVGVSPTYISSLERARKKPSPELAERIADAFDMKVSEMLKPYGEKVTEQRKRYGRELAKARAEKGYTVSLVSGALGIPPTVYREYEQGLCSITEREITTLNKLLGIGEEKKKEEPTPTEVKADTEVGTPTEICDILLEHITDLKVDKETQRQLWHYFSKAKLEAEERRLFG